MSSILNTNEDFEMHIIDNHSSDNTWEYIQSIEDPRVKSKIRIDINIGLINALNINLTTRRPDQYFITLDNDVYIESPNWITDFMKVFHEFPEVGLLGIRNYQTKYPVVSRYRNGLSYLELKSSSSTVDNYIPGSCMFIRPELMNVLGYFSEENCFGDMEICYRVNNFTSFKCGFMTNVKILRTQIIPCEECLLKNSCKLNEKNDSCFIEYSNLYKNKEFRNQFRWKLDESIKDIKSGARTVYCASSYDLNSLKGHIFNSDWALENIKFFVENAN